MECKYCGKNELKCKHALARKDMFAMLKALRKQPTKAIAKHFQALCNVPYIFSRKALAEPRAFSVTEDIDKFVIVAVKSVYLKGERSTQNKKDYKFLQVVLDIELGRFEVSDPGELLAQLYLLWEVNVEIFCLNDICQTETNDIVVAESSRRMVEMMKERNRIKKNIAALLDEEVHEVKQYGL